MSALLAAALASLAPACEGTVRGQVVQPGTGGPLAGVSVDAGHGAVRTDADGRFVMVVPCGRAVLLVTLDNGAVQLAEAEVGESGLDLAIEASPRRFEEVLEVTATTDDSGIVRPVRPVVVAETAGATENVFRVLTTLPGVAGTDEFTSRLAVRGGGPDQNLTLMDGVEIHDPYRLFGLTSAFNPETVQSFDLSTGAFSARHGDRLSSILAIENRAGTEQRGFAGSAALALTDTNVVLEGRLPDGKGSWLVAGRRTYYDLVAERIVDDDLPSFGDLQAKLAWRPTTSTRLALFGLRSAESGDAEFDGDRPGEGGAFRTDAANEVASLSFEAGRGGALVGRSWLAYTRTSEGLDVDAQFRAEDRRSNAPDDDAAFSLADVVFTRELSVRDLSARQEVSWQARPSLLMEAGAAVHALQTRVGWRIAGDRNLSEANGSSVRGGVGLPDELDSTVDGTRAGAFAQATWRPSDRLTVEPGLRFDRGSLGSTAWSPRLAATLAVGEKTRLRAAWGIHTQSPGYEKLVSSDYFVDLSPEAAEGLVHERAQHLLLSVERTMGLGLSARVEAYHKSFHDLVVGRLETEAERAARLARYDFPPALAGSVPADPIITDQPVNGAEGGAWGVELYLERQPMDAGARLTGWLSYAWGRTERDAYGRVYPFDYDREHAASLVGNLRLSDRWDLAFTGRVASGFPRTPALGLRVSGVEDAADADGDGDAGEIVPERDPGGRLVWTVDRGGVENLNTAALPFYARLDLRLTWRPRGPQGRWSFYLDVINATNRDNAGRIEEPLEHQPGAVQPRLVESRDGAVPFLPSIGVRFRF